MKKLALFRSLLLWYRGYFGPIPQPKKWVFVVGCYGSGTTLLHKLLASHPDIGSMEDEGQFFQNQLPVPRDVGWARSWALAPQQFHLTENSFTQADPRKIKRQWFRMYDDPHKPYLIEKSPTNAARTRWLQKHFSPACFIGIVRNGYAVAESQRRKAHTDVKTGALQWARSNEIMLEDFEQIQHKKLITYESLVSRPDECVKEVLHFIGVESHSISVSDKNWEVLGQSDKIRNMNDVGIARLTENDFQGIEEVAGPMLRRFNYLRPSRKDTEA